MTTGMNPSWVLSDEQRKKRFKKYRWDSHIIRITITIYYCLVEFAFSLVEFFLLGFFKKRRIITITISYCLVGFFLVLI